MSQDLSEIKQQIKALTEMVQKLEEPKVSLNETKVSSNEISNKSLDCSCCKITDDTCKCPNECKPSTNECTTEKLQEFVEDFNEKVKTEPNFLSKEVLDLLNNPNFINLTVDPKVLLKEATKISDNYNKTTINPINKDDLDKVIKNMLSNLPKPPQTSFSDPYVMEEISWYLTIFFIFLILLIFYFLGKFCGYFISEYFESF